MWLFLPEQEAKPLYFYHSVLFTVQWASYIHQDMVPLGIGNTYIIENISEHIQEKAYFSNLKQSLGKIYCFLPNAKSLSLFKSCFPSTKVPKHLPVDTVGQIFFIKKWCTRSRCAVHMYGLPQWNSLILVIYAK
jgi:hypothetical protein